MKLHSVDAGHLKANDFKTAKQHRKWNRYSDILAIEKTLFPPHDSGIGYINANWIQTSAAPAQPFVAAQAPTPECIAHFWHSVYHYKMELIFMLTGDVERGIPKADRYWPKKQGDSEVYDCATMDGAADSTTNKPSFRVTLVEEERDKERQLIFRRLEVVPCSGKNKEVREVRQVQYLGWPDHGVPNSTIAFQCMVREINQHEQRHTASSDNAIVPPIMVHCSAGVGRTGTLIAVYAVLRRLSEVGRWLPDTAVYDTVRELKLGRYGMVQRAEQYHFIYSCVVEEFVKLPPLS